MKNRIWWENIVGDGLIISFGVVWAFMFITIEVFGVYGQEANQYMRWFEMSLSIPILILGCLRLKRDI